LQHIGMSELFDVVIAQDRDSIRDKSNMILDALEALHVGKGESVMVGDSLSDLNAAKDAGVEFIGVRYGFGLKEPVEGIKLVDTVDDLRSSLLNRLLRVEMSDNLLYPVRERGFRDEPGVRCKLRDVGT